MSNVINTVSQELRQCTNLQLELRRINALHKINAFAVALDTMLFSLQMAHMSEFLVITDDEDNIKYVGTLVKCSHSTSRDIYMDYVDMRLAKAVSAREDWPRYGMNPNDRLIVQNHHIEYEEVRIFPMSAHRLRLYKIIDGGPMPLIKIAVAGYTTETEINKDHEVVLDGKPKFRREKIQC